MTRQELAWQKAGARRALEYTMAPLALCLGVNFRTTLERAVEALFEADETFYCPPAPPSGTDVVPASKGDA